MRYWVPFKQAVSRVGIPIWIGILAIALLSATGVYSQVRTNAAQPKVGAPPQVSAIYLADPAHSVLDLASAQAAGIRIVNDATSLQAQTTSVDAVIIDTNVFSSVSQTWLAAQLQQGRIIVGLNVPASRLEQIPGYRQPDHPDTFREDWQGRPFYSFVYQRRSNGQLHVGASSDQISSSRAFLSHLNLAIQDLKTIDRPELPKSPAKATAAPR